jgi:hypothetical protein
MLQQKNQKQQNDGSRVMVTADSGNYLQYYILHLQPGEVRLILTSAGM